MRNVIVQKLNEHDLLIRDIRTGESEIVHLNGLI